MADAASPAPEPEPDLARIHPLLGEVVRRVVRVAQPDRIILFGSTARGTTGAGSDIDLLVVKSGVQHRRRLAQQIYLELIGLAVGVDVIVVTPGDIEAYGGKVGTVLEPALREGRQVYAAA